VKSKTTLIKIIHYKIELSAVPGLVGLVPLTALGYLLLNEYSTQSESYNDNNLEKMTLFLAKNTDQILEGYNNASKLMYGDNWYERLRNSTSTNQISTFKGNKIRNGFFHRYLCSQTKSD
jgi:lysyl-tRNA synthetase class I